LADYLKSPLAVAKAVKPKVQHQSSSYADSEAESEWSPQERLARELWDALLYRSHKKIPDHYDSVRIGDKVIVRSATREGGSILVGADLTVLYYGKYLSDQRAIEAFDAGRRTPLKKFGHHFAKMEPQANHQPRKEATNVPRSNR